MWVKKYRNTTVVSYLLEVELLGYGVWMFNFTKWYQIVFWSGCTSLYFGKQFCQFIYFDLQCVRVIVDLYSLQHLLLLDFLILIIRWVWNGVHCGFNLYFLIVNEFEHLFICLWTICPFCSQKKYLVISFTHFSVGVSFKTNW